MTDQEKLEIIRTIPEVLLRDPVLFSLLEHRPELFMKHPEIVYHLGLDIHGNKIETKYQDQVRQKQYEAGVRNGQRLTRFGFKLAKVAIGGALMYGIINLIF